MKTSLSLLAAAAAGLMTLTSQAATVCSVTDISPQASACAGFYNGNILNNNAANVQAQKDALASLGLAWDGNFNATEKLSGLNGNHTVDFATLLNGTTYVGMHFGNGQGGPGQATAFYRFDAGTDLDTFTLAYNASSNVVLYATGIPAVPEPGTYAMLLAGLGFIGLTLRRSRR